MTQQSIRTWTIVPVEQTEEMLKAAHAAAYMTRNMRWRKAEQIRWAAQLKEAPQQQAANGLEAEIARLSAALSETLAQLEAERARNVLPADDEPRHPFGAKLHGDWIVIAVSLDTLRHATETSPRLEWYPNGEHQPVMPVVTDLNAFADEFVGALNAEGEDGSTLITAAFDTAIVRAIELGANGVEVAEAARDLVAARAAIIPGDAS